MLDSEPIDSGGQSRHSRTGRANIHRSILASWANRISSMKHQLSEAHIRPRVAPSTAAAAAVAVAGSRGESGAESDIIERQMSCHVCIKLT